MILKYNNTGTHTQKDVLKVRLDLYPESTDKSYASNYIYVPVIPEKGYTGKVDKEGNPVNQKAYDLWLAGLPHIWQLNPCLSVFIKVDENITKELLTQFVGDIYKGDVLATIDDSIIQANASHLISPYMRSKVTLSTAKTTTFDALSKANIDFVLKDFSITKASIGSVEDVKPQSIDVGSDAINRATYSALYVSAYRTRIDYNNPANATGVLDTVQVYINTATTGNVFMAGTFTNTTGTTFVCTDGEECGAVSTGLNTITGLSINVTSGDYIGCTQIGTPLIRVDSPSGDGTNHYYATGQYCDPSDSASYTVSTGYQLSLYATGTESGGSTPVSDTLQMVWNSRAKVSDTNQLIWHTRAKVSDTLQAIWHVRAKVSDVVQCIWNTRAKVADSLQAIWNVRSLTAKASEFVWNVQALASAVSDSLQLIWDVRTSTVKSSQFIWGVRNLASKASQLIWNVRSTAPNFHGLSGFAHRIAITIPVTNIDADLADFPVLLWLSTSSGTGSTDLTPIFTEISDANRKKIAVTTSDGTTQCYVEIVSWDAANKKAELHVKVPVVDHDASTILYFYFDSSHTDNDSYVGDTTSTPAKAVWDSDFKAVYHMNDGADNAHIYDSTSNVNHGVKKAANEPVMADGLKGKAQSFDGSDDYIYAVNHASLNPAVITVEAFTKLGTLGSLITLAAKGKQESNNHYWLSVNGASKASFEYGNGTKRTIVVYNTVLQADQQRYIAGSYDGASGYCYLDGLPSAPNSVVSGNMVGTTLNFIIGSYRAVAYYWNNLEDEVRISSIARSAAWIKATNYNLRDELVSWGTVNSLAVVRTIWNVKAKVTDTLQTIWNVRNLAAKTNQFIWHTRTKVTDTIQTIWNTKAKVTDTLQAVWNVRAKITDSLQAIWHVRTKVADTIQMIWNIIPGMVVSLHLRPRSLSLTLASRSTSLHLKTRVLTLTLSPRGLSLTLRTRSRSLTLPDRNMEDVS